MSSKHLQEVPNAAGEICNFYAGKTIFITGAAGFLGTVLLERLLRCCPGIAKFYILLRSKKGVLGEERKNTIFKKDIFNKLKATNPDVLKKVTALTGDTTKDQFGLNENDYSKLTEEVSVVFHMAATLSFTKPLGFIVQQNVIATKNILELCRKLENLEAFVYTSSIFSSCNQKGVIDEKIYDLPFTPDEIIKLARDSDEHEMMRLYRMCDPPFPNFYTFSKCVVENILREKAYDLPVCIIRPSIIFASLRGSLPGYIEEGTAIINLAVWTGKGFVHVLAIDRQKKLEIIPVDVTANAHIVAAFNQATKSFPSPSVYNCVSGELTSHTWGDYLDEIIVMAKRKPLPESYVYPIAICCKNQMSYNIFSLIFHYMPAAITDMFLWLGGSSFRIMKMYKFFDVAMQSVKFFATNDWDMKNKNFQLLSKGLNAVEKEMFCMDVKDFKLDEITKSLQTGAAVYRLNGKPYEENFKWKCLRYFLTFSVLCILLGSSSSILYLVFKILKVYSVYMMSFKTRRSKLK